MASASCEPSVFQVNTHLMTLQSCLTTLMGHPISMEQLRLDVGHMVEKMTQITIMFRRIKLKMEEYVCLKVYILLNKGKFQSSTPEIPQMTPSQLSCSHLAHAEVELEGIQERYVQVLRSYLQHTAPNNPGRLGELLAHIPEVSRKRFACESHLFPLNTTDSLVPARFKPPPAYCSKVKCFTYRLY